MFANFTNCLPVTLEYEGDWSDHPKDPGGATQNGVTLAVYRKYRPGASKADLRAISPIEVEQIYRDGYWKPIKGDDLPVGVDLAVFDFGVNSGVSRASKYLQRVVGVDADGKIGLKTLSAVRDASGKEVIQDLCGRRLSFVQALSTFSTFGKGWSRRIANVEAKAVTMWLTARYAAAPPAAVKQTIPAALVAEADEAENKVAAGQQKAGSTVAGGTAAGGIETAISGEPNWILIGVLVSFVACALAVFLARARHDKARADAYLNEAGLLPR